MQFYDMHSHILPEFDDGARSVEESLVLIECLKKQGVKNICLTPHFYTNEVSYEDFIRSRNKAFDKFKQYIPEDINIVLGAEVYVTHFIFNNSDLSKITYGNSRYILTEFPYNSFGSNSSVTQVVKLMENYGLIPVIPHVERYPALVDNPSRISELKKMGVIIQSNISNYAKKSSMFNRRKMLKLVSKGLVDILGSDAHSKTHNTPEVFAEATECIAAKCGKSTVNIMMDNAAEIFNAAV